MHFLTDMEGVGIELRGEVLPDFGLVLNELSVAGRGDVLDFSTLAWSRLAS